MYHTHDELIKVYKVAVRARFLDECLQEVYLKMRKENNVEKKATLVFSAIGAELGQSAVSVSLDKNDFLIPRYRGFASFLGKGIPPIKIIAEYLGKKGGTSKGLGDAAGVHSLPLGVGGYSINLGSMFSVAIGLAFSKKKANEKGIVTIFFGDGEASRSTFFGAMNVASIWEVPLLFVCENNGLSISMDLEHMSSTPTISERGRGFSISSLTVRDDIPLSMYEGVLKAISYVRHEKKPFLLEIRETRFGEHSSESSTQVFYGASIKNSDPLQKLKIVLLDNLVSKDALMKIEIDAKEEMNDALFKALNDKIVSEEDFDAIYYE